MMTNDWTKAIEEVQTVLQKKLSKETIPNGNYELSTTEVPLYNSLRKDYNKGWDICPVVVYNDPKWNVGYYQNDVLAVGFWEGFSINTVKAEWVEKTQKREVVKTNNNIKNTRFLKAKIKIAADHNKKGIEDGWLEDQEWLKGKAIYKISMSNDRNDAKVSKSEHCYSSLDIDISYNNLDRDDISCLRELLNSPEYFWREYEKIQIWNVINKLIGIPENLILLEEVKGLDNNTAPPVSLLGKLCNTNSHDNAYEFNHYRENVYCKYEEAPESFTNLLKFISNNFDGGNISEGEWYDTVRHGECHSGAEGQLKFNLCLNRRLYEIELYGSDRGGSAYNPASYKKDFTVKKIDEGRADYVCEMSLNNDVIFRNLARKLRASYPFENSGIPIAGII